MSSIGDLAFAAIDFESAGKSSEPIQIGLAVMDCLALDQGSFFRSYLKTRGGIDWHAQKVHGISRRDLEGAPALQLLWPEVKGRLHGRWAVAHGAGTEKRYLRAFPLHPFGPWVDTLSLSRAIHPDLPSYALGDLARTFNLEREIAHACSPFRWHDALCDSVATLIVLRHLIKSAHLEGEPADLLLRPDNRAYSGRIKKSAPPNGRASHLSNTDENMQGC